MTEYPDPLTDRLITDAALDLTGRTIERVHFDGCTLTLSQDVVLRTTLVDCLFFECVMLGDGWQWLELEPVSVH